MKISFILPEHEINGGNLIVSCYARELQKRGHQVTLIAPKKPAISIRDQVKSILGFNGWNRNSSDNIHFYTNVDYKIVTLNKHRTVIAADVPDGDIVIATWWKTVNWVNELPPSKGTKIHFIQGYDATEYSAPKLVDATWKLPFYKIAVSRWLAELGRKQMNVTIDRIIHNSVELNTFYSPKRPRPSVPTVGFLYSDYPGKGTETVVDVLKQLKKNSPQLRAFCFGNPSPGSEINLPEWIEFFHQPPQEKIREIYTHCNVWFYASEQDGFGLTPVEAMACRCPVVTTNVGAMPELIENGKNGYLISVGDIEAMVRRITSILSCPDEQWQSMSDHAFDTASRYTWEDATNLFEQSLNDAVSIEARQRDDIAA